MEKRKGQISGRRSQPGKWNDGEDNTRKGIQVVPDRGSLYEFGTSGLALELLDKASYRDNQKTSGYCPKHRFLTIIVFLILLVITFLFFHKEVSLQKTLSGGESLGKHHGSVLQSYGKSEDIKMMLRQKDGVQRDKLILDEISSKRKNGDSEVVTGSSLDSLPDHLLLELVSDRREKMQNMQKKVEERSIDHNPNLKVLKAEVETLIQRIRFMKQHDHVVMETNATAKLVIHELQEKLRTLIPLQYGPPPYRVEMRLKFPKAMEKEGKASEEAIVFELAPIDLVPYSVYFFLHVLDNWKGGAFHRRAGHVLQAMVSNRGPSLAFQEYHSKYPHVKHTLGYAGRPGGPEFYISTVDNSFNHGPGSQGSATEADSCFGKVIEGIDVIKRMQSQPGAGPSGFINDQKNFIRISSMRLLTPQH